MPARGSTQQRRRRLHSTARRRGGGVARRGRASFGVGAQTATMSRTDLGDNVANQPSAGRMKERNPVVTRVSDASEVFRRVFTVLEEMEALQRSKVLELARRLRPGLTAEDVMNPHDFPDLDDPD